MGYYLILLPKHEVLTRKIEILSHLSSIIKHNNKESHTEQEPTQPPKKQTNKNEPEHQPTYNENKHQLRSDPNTTRQQSLPS